MVQILLPLFHQCDAGNLREVSGIQQRTLIELGNSICISLKRGCGLSSSMMLCFQVRAGGRRVQVQPMSERRLLPQPHQQVCLRVRHELRWRHVPDGRKRHLLLRGFALVAEPLPAALLPDPQAGRRARGGLGRKRLSLCVHVREGQRFSLGLLVLSNG